MKRSNGTGTVVKLSGARRRPYVVRISTRDERGRVVQRALSYHARLQDAQAALEEYNRRRAAGEAPPADKLAITVQQVFDAWSAREYKKLGPASVASYNAAWSKRVSRVAGRRFRDMTLDDWQGLIDEAEADGLSQSTINNTVLLIKALSSHAMRRDIIVKDYSEYIEIPSVAPIHLKGVLDDLQLARLEQMARSGVPWADTVLMLCYTGFRVSEFLSLTRFSYHPEDGGYLQGGMKTSARRGRAP